MNHRQRQLAAIRHEVVDRISLDCICVEPVDELAEYLNIEPGAVLDRLGIDGRQVGIGIALPGPTPEDGPIINNWGTTDGSDYGTHNFFPLADAATVADVQRYKWPAADMFDYQTAIDYAKSYSENYAVRGPCWNPLFDRVCGLMGMETAMVNMLALPDMFEATLAKISDHLAEMFTRVLDGCGESMPIFSMGDDFATQRGMMISPDNWRKFLKPHFARFFEIAKSRGRYVWFHSCGDITPVLPDLIDIGMDVWETVQLHALSVSPAELKRDYGKHITFFGGINTQRLPFATPGEVAEEVRRVIDVMAEGGGFICGPDHHIKPDVPPANAVALFDTATDYTLR